MFHILLSLGKFWLLHLFKKKERPYFWRGYSTHSVTSGDVWWGRVSFPAVSSSLPCAHLLPCAHSCGMILHTSLRARSVHARADMRTYVYVCHGLAQAQVQTCLELDIMTPGFPCKCSVYSPRKLMCMWPWRKRLNVCI